jgi:hypothetical protein
MTGTYVVRVWLPDRPGALGQVASRIGAVGADVVGIDILERGGGRAIDELVVELPDESRLGLLVAEVGEVDGVDVEEVRPVAESLHDPRLEALEIVAIVVGATERGALLDALVTHGRRVPGGSWCAVIGLDDGAGPIAVAGSAPSAAWLVAFVEGSRSSARVASGETGPDDVMWAPLPSSGCAIVIGRTGTPYRARERRQLAALARVADTRLAELARARHPSAWH